MLAGLHKLCQPASLAVRKWTENKKIKRKWREDRERKWTENEEMERDLLSTFPHFFFISSFSITFLYKELSQLSQNVKHIKAMRFRPKLSKIATIVVITVVYNLKAT